MLTHHIHLCAERWDTVRVMFTTAEAASKYAMYRQYGDLRLSACRPPTALEGGRVVPYARQPVGQASVRLGKSAYRRWEGNR